jgi:small subunit ribosomal protein S14
MAKTSSIEKNNRRRRMVLAQAPKRMRLKALAKDRTKTPEERFAARLKLAEMPRNGSKVRVRNRCEITGRPRGTFRQFGLARNKIRELAFAGDIPGVTKASW